MSTSSVVYNQVLGIYKMILSTSADAQGQTNRRRAKNEISSLLFNLPDNKTAKP